MPDPLLSEVEKWGNIFGQWSLTGNLSIGKKQENLKLSNPVCFVPMSDWAAGQTVAFKALQLSLRGNPASSQETLIEAHQSCWIFQNLIPAISKKLARTLKNAYFLCAVSNGLMVS